MAETYIEKVHTENAVLDIGEDIGALVIYTGQEMLGKEIEVSPKGNRALRIHTAVLERKVNGRTFFAALFLELPEGDYITLTTPSSEITIIGGQVAELNWQALNVIIHPKALSNSHPHQHGNVSSQRLAEVSTTYPRDPVQQAGQPSPYYTLQLQADRYSSASLSKWESCELSADGNSANALHRKRASGVG